MYTIESAYGVLRADGSQWQEHQVAQMTAVDVFSEFRQLYLTLSSPVLSDPVYVDFIALQPGLAIVTETLENIFTNWGPTMPPSVAEIPKFKAVRAVFTDGFRAGYTIHTAKPGSHYTSSALPSQKTEVQITRLGTNMETFFKYCLVSVNGYFYQTETDKKIVYVPHAGKSLYMSRNNQIGFISFESVGEIKQVAIKKPQVRPAVVGGNYSERVHVDLPDLDLTNKSVLLVLAGHLHFIGDGVFWPVSNNTFCIDMQKVPSKARFFESRKHIDYSEMKLTNWTDSDLIQDQEFFSNEKFINYIAHEQSFFVVIDTPRLTKAKMPIRRFELPGLFISYREPKEVLVTATGRIAEYWKRHENGEWRVTVADSYRANRVFFRTPDDDQTDLVGSNMLPYRPYYNSRAYMLDIICDKAVP